jgi:glycosyltransferase involved in cell wall biosynthesis
MRVLIATDAFFPKIDGVAETTGIVSRLLARKGHEVTILAPAPGASDYEGVRVVRLRSLPLPFYREVRVSYGQCRLSSTLRRVRAEATILMTPGTVGLGTARALSSRDRMLTVYTTDIPRYLSAYRLGALNRPVDRMMRWMSSRSDVTLCPTEVVRTDLASRSFPRLEVWGRGVDRGLFNPDRRSGGMRIRLTGGEPEKPLVLYAGRLAREKRLIDLLAAARKLPGVRFALVGDGPDRDALERQFASVPVVFTGFLRGIPLAEAFASADVFAFPSESETFGQVVLQAMASGVPPVVIENTAPAEFVEHGISGLHIPGRAPAALAAAIRNLIDDPHGRTDMGHRAAEASRSYSWDHLVDRLEQLLTRR